MDRKLSLIYTILNVRFGVLNARTIFPSLSYFVLYSFYLYKPLFIDEADNLIGGRVVSNGDLIYRDYFSQHTPFMYYLSGFFHKIGFHTLIEQRICFYSLFAILLGLITRRYQNYFGLRTIWFGLLLFSSSFVLNTPVSYAVVSEHIQTISYIALFFELIKTFLFSRFNLRDALWISLFSFLSIGTTFISIYFVFIVVVGIAYKIISMNDYRNLRNIWNQILALTAIILAPWIIFISWYALNGTLNLFYEQSFKFNTEVYSLFSGLGNDVLAPFKTGILQVLISSKGAVLSLLAAPVFSIRTLLNVFSVLYLISYLFIFKKERFLGVSVFFLLSVTAMRGTSGYHAIPYWGITTVSLGLILFGLKIINEKTNYQNDSSIIEINSSSGLNMKISKVHPREKVGSFARVLILFLTFSVSFAYFDLSKEFVKSALGKSDFPRTVIDKDFFVQKLASKDKKFYMTSLDFNPYINSGFTPSADGLPALPWITHVYEKQIIEKLRSERTPLIFYRPDSYYRLNTLAQFAPNLVKFIEENYSQIEGNFTFYWEDWISGSPINQPQDGVWVRKSNYPKVISDLRSEYPEVFNYKIGLNLPSSYQNLRTGEILEGVVAEQSVISTEENLSGIQLLISKYGLGRSVYSIKILNQNQEILRKGSFSLRDAVDNSYYLWNFPEIKDSKNKKFIVQIEPSTNFSGGDFNVTSGNSLILWLTEPNYYSAGVLKIGGVVQNGSIAINLVHRINQ
jgi:hypothetical protein